DLDDRISVFATEFQGKPQLVEEKPVVTSWWSKIPDGILLGVAGAMALLIIVLIVVLVKRRRKVDEYDDVDLDFDMFEQPVALDGGGINEIEEIDLSELGSKSNPKRKTIEKLAK